MISGWLDNHQSPAGSGDGAHIRKLGAGGSFAQVTALPPNTTGYTDTGLERYTEYIYRVMACNLAGCSAPSAEVTETTPALGVFIGEEELHRC